MSSGSLKRIQKELKDAAQNPPDDFCFGPIEGDLFKMEVSYIAPVSNTMINAIANRLIQTYFF